MAFIKASLLKENIENLNYIKDIWKMSINVYKRPYIKK